MGFAITSSEMASAASTTDPENPIAKLSKITKIVFCKRDDFARNCYLGLECPIFHFDGTLKTVTVLARDDCHLVVSHRPFNDISGSGYDLPIYIPNELIIRIINSYMREQPLEIAPGNYFIISKKFIHHVMMKFINPDLMTQILRYYGRTFLDLLKNSNALGTISSMRKQTDIPDELVEEYYHAYGGKAALEQFHHRKHPIIKYAYDDAIQKILIGEQPICSKKCILYIAHLYMNCYYEELPIETKIQLIEIMIVSYNKIYNDDYRFVYSYYQSNILYTICRLHPDSLPPQIVEYFSNHLAMFAYNYFKQHKCFDKITPDFMHRVICEFEYISFDSNAISYETIFKEDDSIPIEYYDLFCQVRRNKIGRAHV